ncbi:MAG: hypothetical protein HDR88_17590 [Bacteroides sp.]|nr:hypothetical protein [Bacteroides sp.]
METVIILMMLLVSLSFMLKLTFMRPWQMVLEAALVALLIVFSIDIAVLQSKTQIEEWIQTPELMLNVAVIMTIDVALQIAFCISMVGNNIGLREKILRNILLFIPGLLIFPVAFYLLVSMIFFFTGTDFYTVGYGLGFCLLILLPIMSIGLKYLLPDRSSRLELIFYLNCIIGMLGIIATVNGQTATMGVNELNLPALLTIIGIILIGYIIGFIMYKRKINKQS